MICGAAAGVAAAASTDFTELATSPEPVVASGAPKHIAAADFDGDSDPDLAVANFSADRVTIHLNDGDGDFDLDAMPVVGNGPNWVFAGDLDGDTDIDLAVANQDPGSVTLLRNRGVNSGEFVEPESSPEVIGGFAGWSVTGDDFDGDGDVDLAFSSGVVGDSGVTILRHAGTGMNYNVTGNSPIATGAEPAAIVTADFDGDGDPDLATADSSANRVTVLRGGVGTNFFEPNSSPEATAAGPNSLVAADLDGDLDQDLAVAAGGRVTILRRTVHANFVEPSSSPEVVSGAPLVGIVAADFDGDVDPDLAATNFRSDPTNVNDVSILEHVGTNLNFFEPATSPESAGDGARGIAAADVDGDLDPDLVVANSFTHDLTVLGND